MNKHSSSSAGIINESTIDHVLKVVLSDNPLDLILGIMAPTGSGKSTTLIEAIQRKASIELGRSVKIFVVEPTIVAVHGLYRRMTSLYGDSINISYAAESNVKYDNKSEIVYCTDGHMENKMLSNFRDGAPIDEIDFCDILVLDEAHKSSLAQDTIVSLWKTALSKNVRVPKLIFVSATLNINDIGFLNIKIIKVDPKSFNVEIMYSDKDYEVDSKLLYRNMAEIIYKSHLETPIKSFSNKPDNNGVKWPGYDQWLCFCPGQKEVLTVADILQNLIEEDEKESKSKKQNLEVIPIFGSIGPENYMKIFIPPQVGIRRVIISTNLAESSVTIEFVTWIFDTMTEKYTETTPSGGERLALGNISRSSAKQRAGRTGRVCPGKVTRMCTENYYLNHLEEQRLPEIKRVPLHNMIIKILNVGLDPAEVFSGRIEKESLKISIKTLTLLGMIKDGEVTAMGNFATHFPLSVRGSAILWHWIEKNYSIFPGIVMSCLIDCYDNQSYFFYPFSGKESTIAEQTANNNRYYEEHFRIYAGEPAKSGEKPKTGLSDLEVLIVMWHHLVNAVKSLRPKKSVLKKWCIEHSMNHKKIAECLNAMSKVYGTLRRSSEDIKLTEFSPRLAIINITSILNEVYSDQICVLSDMKRNTYKNSKTQKIFTLDTRNPLTLNSMTYGSIVALRVRESIVAGGNNRQNFITLYMPILTDSHIPEEDYDIRYPEVSEPIKTGYDEDDKFSEGDSVDDLTDDEFTLTISISKSNPKTSEQNYEDFFGNTKISLKPKTVKKSTTLGSKSTSLTITSVSSNPTIIPKIVYKNIPEITPPKATSPTTQSSTSIKKTALPVRSAASMTKSTTSTSMEKSTISISTEATTSTSMAKSPTSTSISRKTTLPVKSSTSTEAPKTSKLPSKFLSNRTLKEYLKQSEEEEEEEE